MLKLFTSKDSERLDTALKEIERLRQRVKSIETELSVVRKMLAKPDTLDGTPEWWMDEKKV